MGNTNIYIYILKGMKYVYTDKVPAENDWG